MSNISVPGGGHVYGTNHSDTITVYGNGYSLVDAKNGSDSVYVRDRATVWLGNGDDTAILGKGGYVFGGNGNDSIVVSGGGWVDSGNGNDTIQITGGSFTQYSDVSSGQGNDQVTILGAGGVRDAGGNDTVNLQGSGYIWENGGGFDSINLGSGNNTVWEQGNATLIGSFGQATVQGAEFDVTHNSSAITLNTDFGHVTMVGTAAPTKFIAGEGFASMVGGSGNDTFFGGSGHDTMMGASGKDVFAFVAADKGGTHVIQDFASGQDKLYLEGQSLAYLQSHGQVSEYGGNTYISLDNGKTMIELQGVTNLHGSDVTTKKP